MTTDDGVSVVEGDGCGVEDQHSFEVLLNRRLRLESYKMTGACRLVVEVGPPPEELEMR